MLAKNMEQMYFLLCHKAKFYTSTENSFDWMLIECFNYFHGHGS